MTNRISDIVVLAEDRAQQALIRAFLQAKGCDRSRVRYLELSAGGGSGEQRVRNSLPDQLRLLRARQAGQVLIVAIDADTNTVETRMSQLRTNLTEAHRATFESEYVVVLVPKRNVETWGLCLIGQSPDEETNYRKPGLALKQWQAAGRSLVKWSRPNADVPATCVDSLRRVLKSLNAIPKPG